MSCPLCFPSLLLPNCAKLVKTAELPPNKNYVLGAHPHGILSIGAFCNFLTECNDFSQRFPGLQSWFCTLAGLFYVPVYRDYIMGGGEHTVNGEERMFDPILPTGPRDLP